MPPPPEEKQEQEGESMMITAVDPDIADKKSPKSSNQWFQLWSTNNRIWGINVIIIKIWTEE